MKNVYETKDMYLSAFLIINQSKLIKTVPDGAVVFFHFEDSPKLRDHILKYFARTTSIEPLNYISTIRSLRYLVNDTLNQKRGREDY